MKSAAEHNAKLIAEYEEQIQVKIPLAWKEWNIQTKNYNMFIVRSRLLYSYFYIRLDKAELANKFQTGEQIKSLRNQLAEESRQKGQLQGTWWVNNTKNWKSRSNTCCEIFYDGSRLQNPKVASKTGVSGSKTRYALVKNICYYDCRKKGSSACSEEGNYKA